MHKTELAAALAHVQNHHIVRIACSETWNCFTSGTTYEAAAMYHHGRWVLGATDNQGLLTPITEAAAAFFTLTDSVPHRPSDEEVAASITRNTAEKLKAIAARFHHQDGPFKVGEIIVWKDGLCNRSLPSSAAPMSITEVLSSPVRDQSASPESPDYSDICDLRVAVLAKGRGREDDCHLVEVCVDSRRVQHWGGQ